ncbi:type II toxin-antitoxin system RelE/ParE family toxin [Mucilaginibacter ginkgonis]|uniref:Type II toxin-antitoxin system RelE/ParE family toxin n=1 Tax=Mucilaginibacter ginkgonis TaxID=2682091 RepID=A0A6I4I0V8_9SPHI|nr:type II toxin-antitoxin system RelE/ParE family toxin [Mucilaginibacter ginkgonis]QQL48537.1 type II toxin-antitoxin system RelE/ParE family toxin [Mucilaginibacter ginkgonis]
MSFKIIPTPPFERELKRLAKKYISLKTDFQNLINEIQEDPNIGQPIGNNCYKVRLAINSKGKGKSGGARVITYVVIVKEEIYLLSIYDKSEVESISNKEILQRLKGL